jgi:8-oxo-dGTP pyrophosphatase MutT (NUDIX family)
MILTEGGPGIEVLFVERARHETDPWSGDLGFPGGRVMDSEKGRPRQTAERETLEEIGLDLGRGREIGRLDDIRGAHIPIVVSCFVYAVASPAPLILNHEISNAFWFPLEELASPKRHLEATVRFGGKTLKRPAIRLLPAGQTVLWGLTYRMVRQFLVRLDRFPGTMTNMG